MEIIEFMDRAEVAGSVLQVVEMLQNDELFTKEAAATLLMEILQENEYIPKIPFEIKKLNQENDPNPKLDSAQNSKLG